MQYESDFKMVRRSSMLAATVTVASAAADSKPNFVFVLADDLDFDYKQDRKALMPTLDTHLAKGGLEFKNHVAVVPVCGPSRSSMLAGRFPHNTGYVSNQAQASHEAFAAIQNDTLGTWMSKAGYHTAFLGKYVNGLECGLNQGRTGQAIPSGWSHWGGLTCGNNRGPHGIQGALGGTYNYYNASQWQADFDDEGNVKGTLNLTIHTGVHQSDFLGVQAVEQIGKAVQLGKPFFVHVTPLMIHEGQCYGPQPDDAYDIHDPYMENFLLDPELDSHGKVKGKRGKVGGSPCPTVKHAWDFKDLKNPHLPSWNATALGTTPQEMVVQGDTDKRGCCDPWEEERQHMVYRNRTAAVVDLDDMLSTIFDGLEAHGVRNNTYVIFSSDNGFHLGEHRLLVGKAKPYETDIRLPMYIMGPGVPRGETRPHPTTHLDITSTIAHLAGAAKYAPHELDGKSFKDVLTSTPPGVKQWRHFSFSEFYVSTNTWRNIRFINDTSGEAEWTFHWWCSNQSEVFHNRFDPFQLNNIGGDSPSTFGQGILDRYLLATELLGECTGTQCNTMPSAGLAARSLQCGITGDISDAEEAFLDPDVDYEAFLV